MPHLEQVTEEEQLYVTNDHLHFQSLCLSQDVVARAREELGSLVGGFLEEAAAEFQEGRRLAYAFYCRLRELSTKVMK